ncbi:MAG: hypothetical protein KIT27_01565 [Legionellales bacterium]|nr:hypothetical protein [Legionellales bacterium]
MHRLVIKIGLMLSCCVLVTAMGAQKESLQEYGQGDKFEKRCKAEIYSGMIMGAEQNRQQNRKEPLTDQDKAKLQTVANNICDCASPKFKAAVAKNLGEQELSTQTMSYIQECTENEINKLKNGG